MDRMVHEQATNPTQAEVTFYSQTKLAHTTTEGKMHPHWTKMQLNRPSSSITRTYVLAAQPTHKQGGFENCWAFWTHVARVSTP